MASLSFTPSSSLSLFLFFVCVGVYVREVEVIQKGGEIQDCFSVCKWIMTRIMIYAIEDYEGTVSIGGRTITKLRFADNIDGLAGEEEELANLVEHLDKASTAYCMGLVLRRLS